jgi:hypothetical protein
LADWFYSTFTASSIDSSVSTRGQNLPENELSSSTARRKSSKRQDCSLPCYHQAIPPSISPTATAAQPLQVALAICSNRLSWKKWTPIIDQNHAVATGSFLCLIQTLVESSVLYTAVALRCLGIFHSPPSTGSISHIEMIAAEKSIISLRANARPLHMLWPPPAISGLAKHILHTAQIDDIPYGRMLPISAEPLPFSSYLTWRSALKTSGFSKAFGSVLYKSCATCMYSPFRNM